MNAMRLTHRQLEYLSEVAMRGSVSAACRTFRISPSSILAAIRIAEEDIGTTVFTRRPGQGMEATPAGQAFLISVRRFLAAGLEFERSVSKFADSHAPTLRLGCFSPLGGILIPPVLRRYIDSYGDCEINLMEGDQVELRSWLESGLLDLVVTYDLGEQFTGAMTPICRVPAHALLRADDPLARLRSVSMRQLVDRPLILLDLPETRTYLLTLFDLTGRRPRVALRTRSYETVRAAVANGLGVSVLNIRPHHEASPDSDKLLRRPISDPLRQPTLVVADPYGPQKPAYVTAFIETLHRYLIELGPKNFAVAPANVSELIYPLGALVAGAGAAPS